MANVPTSNLTALYTNTTPGTTADPAAVDAAIIDIVATVNSNSDFVNGLISSDVFSRLGVINVMDYNASGDGATTTTGSITAGLKALTVASTSTFAVGQGISIAGAGAAGVTLVTSITAINGLVITLAAAASTTVVAAVVKHDDYVALLAARTAIQAAGGGTLLFPKGNYLSSETIDFTTGNIHILGYGATLSTTVGSLEYAMSFSGSPSSSYSILSAITAGDTTFTVSTANSALLAAGDYIKITTDELYHDMTGRTYYKGEMVKVVSVNTGTGVVTIEANGFILSYSVTALLPVAKKITFIENVTIEGLEISGSGTNDRQVGIQVNTVKNLSIHHCKIHDVEAGIIVKDCLFANVYDCEIYDCNRATTGYGISVEGVTQNVNVVNVFGENNRHTFTTGGGDGVCMYIDISNNNIVKNTNGGLNCHGNARFVVFDTNHVSDSLLGISFYSPHTTIKGNTLVNINQSAIYGTECPINYKITDNVIERCSIVSGDAISCVVTSTVYETSDFAICNNNMINNAVQGSAITLDPGPAKLVDASGNNVANVGYSFITIAAGTKVKANSNTLYNSSRSATNTTYGIRITNTVSASSSAIVNGNDIDKVYNGLKIDNANLAMVDANLINPTTVPYSITASFLRDGSNYPQLFEGTLVWNPGSLADGAGETSSSMTVTGAALGDFVTIAPPYELQGFLMTAYVYDVNAVRIRIQNETGGPIDLASGTWRAIVHKKQ